MGFVWHVPLDPDCPAVAHAFQIEVEPGVWIDDPMAGSVLDDLWESFRRRHLPNCLQCQEYGAANIEVVGP